jgi:hypothetical protein
MRDQGKEMMNDNEGVVGKRFAWQYVMLFWTIIAPPVFASKGQYFGVLFYCLLYLIWREWKASGIDRLAIWQVGFSIGSCALILVLSFVPVARSWVAGGVYFFIVPACITWFAFLYGQIKSGRISKE